jgi:hypothetical protein
MAKDGTNRGGARVGAGAKKKPLADKIAEGNPGGRKLTVMEFQDTADLKGLEMPEPNKMLEAIQKDGKALVAGEIYRNTWQWLNERGCAALCSRIAAVVRTLCHERGSLDSMRGSGHRIWLFSKAPYNRQCHSKPLCGYGSELHESNQPAVDGDFPDRQGELYR